MKKDLFEAASLKNLNERVLTLVDFLTGPQQNKLDEQKIKYEGKERIEASTTEEDDAVESYASLMSRFYTKSQCVEVLSCEFFGCLAEIY